MDDRPRNLRTMLSEAKDTSELMVDLAYAAVYFGDLQMAEEVDELEDPMPGIGNDPLSVGRRWSRLASRHRHLLRDGSDSVRFATNRQPAEAAVTAADRR